MDSTPATNAVPLEAEIRARLGRVWARHCADLDPATFERLVARVVAFRRRWSAAPAHRDHTSP